MSSERDIVESKNASPIDLNNIKPLEWGNDCKAWFLLDRENLCIIHETMPPDSTEQLHFHRESEQFFYVLSGVLGIYINGETYFLSTKQGMFIPKESPHKVFNDSDSTVEFILFATSSPRHDRVEVA
ncbi:MAG: cupin domain-containing protein [Proteobacteria bacterium]|nr:cupin domain-containing protein [Pseudomonadota bacterium]